MRGRATSPCLAICLRAVTTQVLLRLAPHRPSSKRERSREREVARPESVLRNPGYAGETPTMIADNLLANVPRQLPDEQVVALLRTSNVRIERIVSTGQATAPDQWYDQDQAEWVVVIAGSAGLFFEGQAEPLLMEPGSYVHIPAHVRHRVAWTDPSQPTVWLAVRYQ